MTTLSRLPLIELSFLAKTSTILFFTIFISLSPNYISIIIPEFKKIIITAAVLFIPLFIFRTIKITNNNSSIILLFFIDIILITGIINFIRLDNIEGLIFSLSFSLKFLVIYLFIMSFNDKHMLKVLKILTSFIVAICIYSIIGETLYVLKIISVTGSLEFQSYIYNILSFWGVYTVSFDFNGTELIRNQFFFQEPGFFAFYIFIAMIITSFIRETYNKKIFLAIYYIYFITVLSTMSVTGIILSTLLIMNIFKNLIFRTITFYLSVIFTAYIILSNNPYINKTSSLAERFHGIRNGLSIFPKDITTFFLGAGYNSEPLFSFDGKFNNFIFEVVLYSGIINLLFFLLFCLYVYKNCYGARFKYFLALIFCATTPLFWSPIMIILNVILLRYHTLKSIKMVEIAK